MSYLDPVVARFIAEAAEYIGPVEAMAKAADAAREANDKLILSIVDLEAAMALLSDKHVDISASVKGIAGPVAGAVAQINALKAAMAGLDDKTVKITTDMNGTARAAAGWAFGFRLTGQALHWLVMGTLEVAATAIPAMVAFGAAVAGLAPTAINIYQHYSALSTAFGDLGTTANRTGTQVGGLAASFNRVAVAMAPDAYQIFGSIISDLSGKFGVFSQMAQQAGSVLAGFATKITADLNGQAGAQLAHFFDSAVKYMVQWGQVLGNLGHAFLNIAAAMRGVGQILLDVLDVLSRAFLALTSNPVAAWFIGIGAAMSAAYRYGQLLVNIFRWLGGSAIVGGIRLVSTALLQLAGVTAGTGYELLGLQAAIGGFVTGPAGIAIGAIAVALGLWYLNSHMAASGFQSLIKQMQALPPTASNLIKSIASYDNALHSLTPAANSAGHAITNVSTSMGVAHIATASYANRDIPALNKALAAALESFANLYTGVKAMGVPLGTVGQNMQAMEAATELAASQVTKLNQAWDQLSQNAASAQNAFIALTEANHQLGSGLKSTTTAITGAFSTLSNGSKLLNASLNGTNQASLQLRQQWQQSYADIQPFIDSLRMAHLSAAQFSTGVRSALFPLVSLANHTGYAKAQLMLLGQTADGGITTWSKFKQWIDAGGHSLADLNAVAAAATGQLSNLQKQAAALNTSLSQLANSGFNQVRFATSGAQAAMVTYIQALENAHTPASVVAADAAKYVADFHAAGGSVQQATQQVETWSQAIRGIPPSKSFTLYLNTVGSLPIGGGGTPVGTPGGGHVRGPNAGVTINVHGSVLSGQEIGRVVQKYANQKTIRNGSTQLFIQGRLH